MSLRGTNLAWAWIGLLLLGSSGAARGQAPAGKPAAAGPGSPPPSPVGVVLFLSYEASGRPPFDAATLHENVWDRLTAALKESGRVVTPRARMEPFLHKWGVRTSLSGGAEFLVDLSTALGIGDLLIAELAVYSDRLLLIARSTDPGSGKVLWAGVEERRLDPEDVSATEAGVRGLEEAAGRACRDLARDWRDRPVPSGAPEIVLLPARNFGIETATARAMTHCFLASLLRDQRRVRDPGITFSSLSRAGIDPSKLEIGARSALESSGAPYLLLISDLVSYETQVSQSSAFLEEGETPVMQPLRLPAVSVSLRMIDGQSGEVRFAATEFLDAPERRGLFGIVIKPSLRGRMQPVADRLVHAATQKG